MWMAQRALVLILGVSVWVTMGACFGAGTTASTSPTPTPAATPTEVPVSDEENKEWKDIQAFLGEGAYDVVNDKSAAFVKKFPNSSLGIHVRIAWAQGLYQLARDEDALAVLSGFSGTVPADSVTSVQFWNAECYLELMRWPEAEANFRTVVATTDNDVRRGEAKIGLAWSLYQQGKSDEASKILTELAKNDKNRMAAQEAQLIQAKIAAGKKDYDGAATILNGILQNQPEPKVKFQAAFWLGKVKNSAGQYADAIQALNIVTGDAQAFPKKLIAEANIALGQAQLALGHSEVALDSFEKVYELTENREVRFAAFTAYLSAARAAKELSTGIQKLQDFAKTKPEAVPDALYATAAAIADDGTDDSKAIGTLESMVVTYNKDERAGAAYQLLGQLYLKVGKMDDAVRAYTSCLSASNDPDVQRTSHFQLGLLDLKKQDWSGALDHFGNVVNDSEDSMTERALFNSILAEAHLQDTKGVSQSATSFMKRFPKSVYSAQAATIAGDLFASLGRNDEAKTAYQSGLVPTATDDGQRILMKHYADFLYQAGSTDEALATWKDIVTRFPADSVDASERALQALYEKNEMSDAQYEQKLLELEQQYAQSASAAEVLFRLGEFYFYRQDYVKAQATLQQVASAYPESPFAGDACFFAGQAAILHQDLASAQDLFAKVPEGSPFKSQAKLLMARSYHDQLNFTSALAAYQDVLTREKSGPLVIDANLGTGECLFDLAKQDPSNYAKAITSFDAVLNSSNGTPAQRNEAGVRKGNCLEKMGNTDEALAVYLDVLYGRIGNANVSSPPATTSPAASTDQVGVNAQPPDLKWQILGGWEAARIRESQKDWRSAISIYERLEKIGGSDAQSFHDLVNKLRRDNYIYD